MFFCCCRGGLILKTALSVCQRYVNIAIERLTYIKWGEPTMFFCCCRGAVVIKTALSVCQRYVNTAIERLHM